MRITTETQRTTADGRRFTQMNVTSVAVDDDAGATDFQAQPISLLGRRNRSPYLRLFSVSSVSLADVANLSDIAKGGDGAKSEGADRA